MNYTFEFSYFVDGKAKTATENNEDFTLEILESENALKATLIPKKPLSNVSFFVLRDYKFESGARFFANGFQSWTDTREFSKNETMPNLGFIGKSLFGKINGMKYVGDYTFVTPESESGVFHSHSYAYVRQGKEIDFFGSLTDRTGYTVIYADMNKNVLKFSKDVEGITIDKPYEVLDLFLTKGEYDEVFDKYFEALDIKPLTDKKLRGYTSWYNYYENINEEVILRDLDALSEYGDLVDTYQVDDGFETAVGDWFSIDKKKFPQGLKPIADAIHEKGFKAGLWLAPFAAHKKSKIAKDHPDWLIRYADGKPVPTGHNWGGFFALDIYNKDARQYIKDVIKTATKEWGFDLLKLDFLYSAAAIPMHGKTRGEIAYDSIELLRECAGDVPILGCGVQQMPCFGKVEYMRIGADMSLGWEHNFLRKIMHREDVSTPNALYNSIYRRSLSGRAFLCDSDVFLLRRTNIKFTWEQQRLLAKFIKLFGSVLFTSDNIAEYNEEQLEVFKDVLKEDDTKLLAVNESNGTVFIDYAENGEEKTLKFMIKDGTIF